MTPTTVVRAIAITTGADYREVYDDLHELGRQMGVRKPSPRTGVQPKVFKRYLKEAGWTWTPTMFVGQGCRTHLQIGELPFEPWIIVRLSKHITAVGNGTCSFDTHDPSRGGTRCVYGYWSPPADGA